MPGQLPIVEVTGMNVVPNILQNLTRQGKLAYVSTQNTSTKMFPK